MSPCRFGDEIVVYSIGPGSCAVPGLPATLGELSERLGRLPWKRLVEPALDLARARRPAPGDARALARDARRTSSRSGAAARSSLPRGSCSQAGQLLVQPGLVHRARDAGRGGRARASIAVRSAEALLACGRRGLHSRRPRGLLASLGRPRPRRTSTGTASPREAVSPGCPSSCPAFPASPGLSAAERVLALVDSARGARRGGEHTTNMVAVDGQGRACVLTHSLGVGAGAWVPGLDLQLNNLLGESDIAFGEPEPGDHLESRMAPSLVFDDAGLDARDRRRGRDAAANGALDGALGHPRRRARSRGGGGATTRPPHPRPSSMPSLAWTRRRSRSSRRVDAPCVAGRSSITTSAGSAAWAGRAQPAIRGGTAPRSSCRATGKPGPTSRGGRRSAARR